MTNIDMSVQNMVLELRRGVITIAVLCQLDEEQYGYSLLNRLAERGLEIDQGTLYPLLRRLEAQGLVRSDWRIVAETRPRRYYVINEQGRAVLARLKQEFAGLSASLEKMLS